jgi:uroporphyrinogen-III decarboxylase
MKKDWSDMTPNERREERFQKVITSHGIDFVSSRAEQSYNERVKRIIDAIQLRKPDRVPVRFQGGFFSAYYAGISGKDLIYDNKKMVDAFKKIISDFDADMLAVAPPLPGKALEVLNFQLYKWPGYGLGDEALSHQYEEGEYMKADEYDDLIDDPTDFWLRTYLPRVFGALEPLKKLSRFTNIYEIPTGNLMPFAMSDIQTALKSFIKAGDEMSKLGTVMDEIRKELSSSGFPSFVGGFAKAPFDIIGDTLRGTRGVMMDLFRQPDKLIKAMERLTPITIKAAVESANATGKPCVSMPLHKGADGFMSDEQFKKFYWPTLKEVFLGMIEEGIVPMPFAEGTYDSRLKIIRELPKGSTVWLFDRTDMASAKEIIGENICIQGNVPASILTKGSPTEVKEYCRNLIETCGKGGGYMLSPGASAEKAKPENLQSMIDAAKEYGRYD